MILSLFIFIVSRINWFEKDMDFDLLMNRMVHCIAQHEVQKVQQPLYKNIGYTRKERAKKRKRKRKINA